MTAQPTTNIDNPHGSFPRMSTSYSFVPSPVNVSELLALGTPFVEFPRYSILDLCPRICSHRSLNGRTAVPEFASSNDDFSRWLSTRLQIGQPFVIQDFNQLPEWNEKILSLGGLIEHSTKKNVTIQNCITNKDLSFTLKKFAEAARSSYREFKGLYARDLHCPDVWLEQCAKLLPPEIQSNGTLDLSRWLPSCARSEVMMVNFGSEGSSSGFHRCFSSTVALNLLVDSSDQPVVCFGTDSNSQAKYDGFMTARGASPHVDWLNLEPEVLKGADFPIYICEQRPGDLVVFPPATAHQVWNLGSASTKVVWNILHPLSLDVGLRYVQPPFNRLCHPDVARANLALAHAMLSLVREEQSAELPPDLPLLTKLFKQMVQDETIAEPLATSMILTPVPETAIATCNFCNTAIWNRHLRCNQCQDFDLCLMCYLSGRSCEHPSNYSWAEIVPQDTCARVVLQAESILGYDISNAAEGSRILDQRKTLGTAVNELILARQSTTMKLCHLCRSDHLEWKGRRCDKCAAFFCYRGLYRHFDKPCSEVMRQAELWICPKCSENCNCRCCHFPSPYIKAEKPASKRRVRAVDPRGKITGFTDNVFDHKKRSTSVFPAAAYTSPPTSRQHKRSISPCSATQQPFPSVPTRRATTSSIAHLNLSSSELMSSSISRGKKDSVAGLVPDDSPHARSKMRRLSIASHDDTPRSYSETPSSKTILGIRYITHRSPPNEDQPSLPPMQESSHSATTFVKGSPSTMSRQTSNGDGMATLATVAGFREKEPVSMTGSSTISDASRCDREHRGDDNSDTMALMPHSLSHHLLHYSTPSYIQTETQSQPMPPSSRNFPVSKQYPAHRHSVSGAGSLFLGRPSIMPASTLAPNPSSSALPSNVDIPAPSSNHIPTLETQLLRLRQYSDELLSLSLYSSHRLLQDEIRRLESSLILSKKDRSERVLRSLESEFPTLINIHQGLRQEGTRLGYF